MSELKEAVQHELERLEEDAEDIEKSYTEFFTKIATSTVEGVMGSGYFWDTPSDELEGIRREVLREYELWYNSARPLISDYMPERLENFDNRYEDFMERLRLEKEARKDTRKVLNNHNSDFDAQRGILESIPPKVQVEELRVRRQISEKVSQTELDRARRLYDDGEIRASGVVAGVALERYLLMKCENAASEISYSYSDGISTLAQKLYESDEIDSTAEKQLQHLADIRADCAHANQEDPDDNDVRRLLEDVEDYVRGRKI